MSKGWQHNYNTSLTLSEDNSVSVFYPDGHMTLFTYSNGSYTRQAGCFEILTHNSDGTYTLTFKDQTKYTYNAQGKLIQIADKNNNAITLQYSNSVLSSVYEPAGRALQFTYDQKNITSLNTYDANYNRTSETDKNGNLTAVTNARGQTYTFTYDALNRLVEEKDPLGNTNKRTFDPVSNQTTRTRPDGTSVNYSYDANNHLTNIAYPDRTGVSYAYDANGNRTSMVDTAGTTCYSYNKLNRLASVTRSVYSVGYDYDPAGNITGITYPDGLRVSYTYNGLNLPVSVSDSVYSVTISYDEAGNRLQEILPNGITVNYGYDLDGRLTALQHVNGENVTARAAYTLDKVGNRMSVTDEQGKTTRYTYDNLYQLTKADYPDGQSMEYTYDPTGNRTSAGGVLYTYDDANRLIL